MSIDPLTLFLRLALTVERSPDKERETYFSYELTPFPTSLFKDGIMRTAKQKSALKKHLLKNVTPQTPSNRCAVVADGGALLWSTNWSKNEKFSKIFHRYINKVKELSVDTVVFDGYQSSTKDATHRSRSGRQAQVIEIRNDNECPSDRDNFLTNYVNKQEFVNTLASELENRGIKCILCPSDADTTIVKTALAVTEKPVVVLADDTDILILLMHHLSQLPTRSRNVYLRNFKVQKVNDERLTYNLYDVITSTDELSLRLILFSHAFTGSDTTSVIYNFGKTAIFNKLIKSTKLQEIATLFYKDQADVKEIGDSTVKFFEVLHNGESLQRIRKEKYDQMVSVNRAKIDPANLPPSPRAAYYHGLRVYHQLHVWKALSDHDLEPRRWGWRVQNDFYRPIMTDLEAGPAELLKIVRCGCNGPCDGRCSCRKAGLKCTSVCKTCHGITCNNVAIIEPQINEEDNADFNRNFLDIFN